MLHGASRTARVHSLRTVGENQQKREHHRSTAGCNSGPGGSDLARESRRPQAATKLESVCSFPVPPPRVTPTSTLFAPCLPACLWTLNH